jgi:hypothetical protein
MKSEGGRKAVLAAVSAQNFGGARKGANAAEFCCCSAAVFSFAIQGRLLGVFPFCVGAGTYVGWIGAALN